MENEIEKLEAMAQLFEHDAFVPAVQLVLTAYLGRLAAAEASIAWPDPPRQIAAAEIQQAFAAGEVVALETCEAVAARARAALRVALDYVRQEMKPREH